MLLYDSLCSSQRVLPVTLIQTHSRHERISRDFVETIGVALVPLLHGEIFFCLVHIINHLLIDLLHTAATEHRVHIGLQRQWHTACCGRSTMGVRLSKQVDKEEVAVGSHHVSLAHKLVYLVGCGLCDLVLVLDDVVGDIDGVVVATPAKRHRCALLTEVVPTQISK